MSFHVPVVSVVGKGRSGRTTLLEGLISILTKRGYRVATAKNHAHDTDIDSPGKDTWRHAKAGAVQTMVSAPNNLGVFRKVDRKISLEKLSMLARDADILLTEGFGSVTPVKIEVLRQARSDRPIAALDELFALVTDLPSIETKGPPVFGFDDVALLADLIESTFLVSKKHAEPSEEAFISNVSGVVASAPRGPVLYLDHAAGSSTKPRLVADGILESLISLQGSPGRGAHSVALNASKRLFEARRQCATLLGVSSSHNMTFQQGCTAACNLMLNGALEPGDRVVVGSMEHNAVARPLARLAAAGVDVVVVRADRSGLVDPGDVEREVRARKTRAVVCQHASNVSGTIQLIGELAEVAHDNGALLLVDGAQAPGHLEVNLGSLSPDAYAVSGHKGMLGPQGIGILYISPDLDLREQILGGTGGGFSESMEMPRERPDRYEAGTLNMPGIVALGIASAFLQLEGEAIENRERGLIQRLYEGVLEIDGFSVLGPPLGAPRVPLISIVHRTIEADRIALLLDTQYSIATRSGLHCAPWAHDTLGTQEGGALRLSVGWDTREEEVEQVLDALRRIVG